MNVAKVDRSTPETPAQALHWDRHKMRYVARGWCHPCAARAAWGHQLGFTRLERGPCDACRGLPASGSRATRWSNG